MLCVVLAVGLLGCSTNTSDPTDGPSSDVGGDVCQSAELYTGEATYYDFADGSGNCSFPATPNDLRVAAMNATDYAGSAGCGSCVRITGPDGEVDVRIVDQCPECATGDVDLSPEAFAQVAALEAGRVDIEWTYVPCDVSGSLEYHFKDGSNQWWTAVQVRNHRTPIQRFEVRIDGAWVEVPRFDYNYFVLESGMGEGPFDFRVTDTSGAVVEDSGIPLRDAAAEPGAGQFPACG